jgi:hypothetical protein
MVSEVRFRQVEAILQRELKVGRLEFKFTPEEMPSSFIVGNVVANAKMS